MAPTLGGSASAAAAVEAAQAEAPQFDRVSWYREPHLRRLYMCAAVLMVASATTGYDGSLVYTSQLITPWSDFFGESVVNANTLGLLVNMFNIGSILSFFITPYIADNYGRKPAIVAGCFFMILGGCLTAFCNGYGSES
jgi:MFS family permease